MRNVLVVLLFAWLGVMIGTIAYKSTAATAASISEHFTMWAWISMMGFFAIVLLNETCLDCALDWWIYNVLYWVQSGISWIVFWIVYIILYQNSQILLNETKPFGGEHTLGQALLGDRLLHVIPVIVLLIYFIATKEKFVHNVHVARDQVGRWEVHFVFVFVTLIPLALVGLYALLFNPHTIYGIRMHTGLVALVSIGVVFAFIFMPLEYLLYYRNPLRSPY